MRTTGQRVARQQHSAVGKRALEFVIVKQFGDHSETFIDESGLALVP
jgi:hypothetical protein